MDLKLYFCMMGYNRLDELKELKTVDAMLPYVDQMIYVDGSEGKDGTSEWLMSNFKDAPIMVINNKWSDDFPGQRTQYLNLVGQLRKKNEEDSWVIVADTDEVYSPLLAKNIRKLIDITRKKHDMLQIRSKSVTINYYGTRIYENLDDFYKPLVFRYYDNMQYWGDRSSVTGNKTALHEALQVNGRFVWRPINLDDKDGALVYEHIKSKNIIWERGCRNFIVFGGGPNLGEKQPLWKPFRKLLADVMGTDEYTSYDVLQYFKKGNIDQRIKDWMIKYRDEKGYDGSSEVRECFLTYFVLYHPEELPEHLKDKYRGLN